MASFSFGCMPAGYGNRTDDARETTIIQVEDGDDLYTCIVIEVFWPDYDMEAECFKE